MKKIDNPFSFTPSMIAYPLLFVLGMWLVYWYEVRFHVNLNNFGIYPRTVEGLRGIFFGPFLHGGIKHLFNNSIPMFVLVTSLFYFYSKDSWKVLLYGFLLTGFLTWGIGRPSYHIGASGIVYMLVAFLFFKGAFSKHYRLMALSLIIVFLYGGLLWYVFPIEKGISWEGHLSGFFVGFLFAVLFKSKIEKPKIYSWQQDDYNPEEDEFLKHFDENGNFIETPKEEKPPLQTEPYPDSITKTIEAKHQGIIIKYSYKKKEE